jgi:hypothetical protein
MQAEFTLQDNLIILSYLSRDTDPEISSQARKNLIPAARNWFNRPDRPELPEPIREIVMKVIEKVGLGEKAETGVQPAKPWAEISGCWAGEFQAIDLITAQLHHLNRAKIPRRSTRKAERWWGGGGQRDGLGAVYKAFGWIDASFQYVHALPGDFSNRIDINTLNLVMGALSHTPDGSLRRRSKHGLDRGRASQGHEYL